MGNSASTSATPFLKWGRIFFTAAIAAAAGLFLVGLLYGLYCAYTNFKFGASPDYARYTNMIWNSGHGRPFLYGLTESYLQVHLSFTLGLLGFLYHLWDHPFLLALVQWSCLAGGGVLLLLASRKLKVPGILVASLLLYWTAYHFTQSVVLCEFHGVCLYLLLIPALYYCLVACRGLTWLPLALILGMREEAGLIVVPLLLYFAIRDRWKGGYVYAAIALAYVALAVFVLYPKINGLTLLERRAREIQMDSAPELLNSGTWIPRLVSLGWIVLPFIPLIPRGYRALLTIPSLAVITSLASSYDSQVNLRIHYPAPIVACLAVAAIEAIRRPSNRPAIRAGWIALYLVAAVAISHRQMGFMWGATPRRWLLAYTHVSEHGEHVARVAREHVPKSGRLYTPRRYQGFAANRADLVFRGPEWILQNPVEGDILFVPRRHLQRDFGSALTSGLWGVRYQDKECVVLERGYPTDANSELAPAAPALSP